MYIRRLPLRATKMYGIAQALILLSFLFFVCWPWWCTAQSIANPQLIHWPRWPWPICIDILCALGPIYIYINMRWCLMDDDGRRVNPFYRPFFFFCIPFLFSWWAFVVRQIIYRCSSVCAGTLRRGDRKTIVFTKNSNWNKRERERKKAQRDFQYRTNK